MSRKTLKTIATLAAVLATAAVIPTTSGASIDRGAPAVIPATSAANTDLRSPDLRDAARVVVVSNGQDLRSPDGRDAARPSSTPSRPRRPTTAPTGARSA
jgi:hypothetical protein